MRVRDLSGDALCPIRRQKQFLKQEKFNVKNQAVMIERKRPPKCPLRLRKRTPKRESLESGLRNSPERLWLRPVGEGRLLPASAKVAVGQTALGVRSSWGSGQLCRGP